MKHCAATVILALFAASTTSASVIEITDRDEWEAAVGEFTTIDFIVPPTATLITDQYSDLGVNFTGNTYTLNSGLFQNDDWGLQAYLGAWVHFDSPQSWLAVEFPGRIKINLYFEGELFYASDFFAVWNTGRFAGIISEQQFDMVYLHREGATDNHVGVDDLHFGTLIPAPGALGLLVLAGGFTRKRRRGSTASFVR